MEMDVKWMHDSKTQPHSDKIQELLNTLLVGELIIKADSGDSYSPQSRLRLQMVKLRMMTKIIHLLAHPWDAAPHS